MTPNEFYTLRQAMMCRDFSRMNDRQREAVFHADGALLILAGAGSGKTTVLVKRIAFIISYGNAYESTYMPFDMTEAEVERLERAASLPAEEINLKSYPKN